MKKFKTIFFVLVAFTIGVCAFKLFNYFELPTIKFAKIKLEYGEDVDFQSLLKNQEIEIKEIHANY